MVKKQQVAVGGLTCVFSSRSTNKQQDTASPAAAAGEVLPCHPSSSSSACAWQWQWTSCGMHPRTLSFRQQQQQQQQQQQPAEQEEDDTKNGHGRRRQQQQQQRASYKTRNSVCSVDFSGDSSLASVDSFASTASDDEAESDAEAVIQALRSGRLLYEPADDSDDDDASCCRLIKQQSINKHQKQAAVADNDGDDKPQLDISSSKAPPLTTAAAALAFGGATAMSVESHNPYRDFRESMEAMVMSQLGQEGGVKDWRWLEEMLGWYLRANGKTTHGLIVAAFVDLLLALTTSPAPAAADSNYYSSSSSSSSSLVATPPAGASASATNCSAASSIDDCSCCSSSSL